MFPWEWFRWKGIVTEQRFEVRKQEILNETEIQPQVAQGMLKRLEQFAQPFTVSFGRREPKEKKDAPVRSFV